MTTTRRFFRPVRKLQQYLQFGLVWPNYGPHSALTLRRLPNARATVYFASGVLMRSGQSFEHGVFCEGPHARSFEVTGSCTEMVALKLRSGALRAVLGVPASEVHDRTLDLREIWGKEAAALADRIALATTTADRVRVFERALLERVGMQADDRTLVALAGVVERSGGRALITDLAERSGYSRRTIVQKFHDCVGLAPKACSRIARTRSALALVSAAAPATPWAELALASGYCDQAHMSHEFRDLLGSAPAAFTRSVGTFGLEAGPTQGRRCLPQREQQLYRMLGFVSHWASI